MKYSRCYLLACTLALTGCQVTTEEARNTAPVFRAQSHKSVTVLSDCIYKGWSTTTVIAKDETTHREQAGERITVFTWEDSMFTDLTPRGKGSDVKFHTTFRMGETVLEDRRSIVERCL